MRQTSFATMNCSLARSLELVGDWWSPLILRDLSHGASRFEDLADNLKMSRSLLTERLRHLVEGKVVDKVLYSEHPPRYRYELSESGRDLVPVLMALTAWGDRWTAPKGERPVGYFHRDCRTMFIPKVCCSVCGEPVTWEHVDNLPGPGHLARGTMFSRAFMSERLTATDSPLKPARR